MSGLFATLVAAAQGFAPAAEPAPRQRFAAANGPAEGIEWLAREETLPFQSEALAEGGHDAPAEGRRAEGLMDHADGAGLPPLASEWGAGSSSEPAAPLLPPARTERRQEVSRPAGFADEDGVLRSEADDATAAAQAQPSAATSPAGERRVGEAPRAASPLMAQPASAMMFEPLLPPLPAEPAPRSANGGGFTLRIGRIEVRPPPYAAPAPPPQSLSAATRPVSLPRAPVRQSLDHYRATRGR